MSSQSTGLTRIETARLSAAAPPDEGLNSLFSGLAHLAANACGSPLASIAVVGCGATWGGSAAALAADVLQRPDPFAPHAAAAAGLCEIPDTGRDDRFKDCAPTIGRVAVRSYAGYALRTSDGETLGTIGVYDDHARTFSAQQRESLQLLAEQAAAHAENHSRLAELALLGARGADDARAVAPDATRDDLRKIETMFRNTFDQAPIGIVHADRRGNMLRWNQSFCKMLGFDAADLAHGTLAGVTHGDDVARVSAELRRLWTGEIDSVDLERRCVRKDGSALWVRMTTALVREADGPPAYSVEFLRDISARKESAAELERVHKLLITASRQAGMAEVATNVLHNVGNILNSVNISASLVTERVKQSKASGVGRVAALLREQGEAAAAFIAHDERGRQIPDYLASLGEQLMSDRKMALEELAALRENLEHIKDTVSMQQSYAKMCGLTETIAVVDLVEDSLRLNAGAFARHGVTLRREFAAVPPITVDKHKVLQILVNLVRNAKYACDESGRSDKLVILRIEKAPLGVRISVIDNGVGILPENMPRLFTHGFTTRASGHGFGLHSAALAAHELGGTLRVQSDGPGRGATFILELPASAGREAAHV